MRSVGLGIVTAFLLAFAVSTAPVRPVDFGILKLEKLGHGIPALVMSPSFGCQSQSVDEVIHKLSATNTVYVVSLKATTPVACR